MRFLLQLFAAALSGLPRRWAMGLGAALGRCFGSLLRFRRREVLATLARCFPEKSAAERGRIADGMYRHLGLTMVEILRVAHRGRSDFDSWVDFRGEDEVRRIAEARRGALFLMGHIGNWELCGAASGRFPQPVHVVVKPIRSRGASDFMAGLRRTLGVRPLEWRRAFRECLRALKAGQSVAIVLDQNTKRDHGVFVDFLGRPACTTPGLAILSAQTGLPVHPLYVHRVPGGRHEVVVLPPLAPPADKSPAALREATQRYTRALEDIVRRHPEQWLWLHRRWRTQPKPEAV